jgi:hypothetical protein
MRRAGRSVRVVSQAMGRATAMETVGTASAKARVRPKAAKVLGRRRIVSAAGPASTVRTSR